ncbi:hypothetical protein CWE12_02060 [Aliidiomarina sedimenti]|uniref:Lipoprotein n=1 Tax=Aliidiomarina sedimenti TaxID=1933879 RepID=A0ABY0C1X7_9GAMM|nr:DUF6279 family lipoprotein [Aliidiomarina sedimenti]RUO31807.1 hypothetical protein CWE12_02060 [Aliidiomarina sedimenti]
MHRLLKLIVVALIVLGVGACSRSFAYRFADTYIVWQARDYVSLEREQHEALNEEVEAFLQWHAETQIPRYHLTLETLEADITEATLDPEAVRQYSDLAADFWFQVRSGALPAALRLLPDLSDAQVDELIQSVADSIQQRLDEYQDSTADERVAERRDMFQKQAQRWLGAVTGEQQALFDEWADSIDDSTMLWIEYRLEWAEQFASALEQRSQSDLLSEHLDGLFLEPENLRGDVLITQTSAAKEASQERLMTLHGLLTDDQRLHFAAELQELRRDLRSMLRSRDLDIATMTF